MSSRNTDAVEHLLHVVGHIPIPIFARFATVVLYYPCFIDAAVKVWTWTPLVGVLRATPTMYVYAIGIIEARTAGLHTAAGEAWRRHGRERVVGWCFVEGGEVLLVSVATTAMPYAAAIVFVCHVVFLEVE